MIVSIGEVAEWLKAVDSKSTVGFVYRGFESPSLLHFGLMGMCWRGERVA